MSSNLATRIIPAAVVASAAAVLLTGCFVSPVAAGPQRTQTRAVDSDVHSVVLTTSGDLEVVVGDEVSLEISAPARVIDRLTSDSSGGVLTLGSTGGPILFGDDRIRYRLVLPLLDALELDGSGDARADFSGADSVEIRLTGSGDVDASELAADRIRVSLVGSGDARLRGTAGGGEFSIDGSGDLDASALKVTDAVAALSGPGELSVHAVERLDASVSGSGDVVYSGSPRVRSTVSGSGDITSD